MSEISMDKFYDKAQQPDFPDEMVFRITAENPDNPGTFSKEGMNGLSDNFYTFLLARVFARWQKTGKPPKGMTVHISIDWDDTGEREIPWFHYEMVEGDTGLTQIDGRHRIPRKSRLP